MDPLTTYLVATLLIVALVGFSIVILSLLNLHGKINVLFQTVGEIHVMVDSALTLLDDSAPPPFRFSSNIFPMSDTRASQADIAELKSFFEVSEGEEEDDDEEDDEEGFK